MRFGNGNITGTTVGCTIGNAMLLELLEDVPLAMACYRNCWRTNHWQWNVTGTTGGCTIDNWMLPELLEDVPLASECYGNYWRMYHWQWNVTGTTGGCTIGNGMLRELLEDVPLATQCYWNYWRMYHWQRNVTGTTGGCTIGNATKYVVCTWSGNCSFYPRRLVVGLLGCNWPSPMDTMKRTFLRPPRSPDIIPADFTIGGVILRFCSENSRKHINTAVWAKRRTCEF